MSNRDSVTCSTLQLCTDRSGRVIIGAYPSSLLLRFHVCKESQLLVLSLLQSVYFHS